MGMREYAAQLSDLADRAEAELAVTAVRAGARELLAAMEVVTPVLTGALRRSEHVQSVAGDGSHAMALVGPDIIYDRFRNDGGTITRHAPPPAVLGTPATGFFGRKVTQTGAHYMERAEEEGRPAVLSAMRGAVEGFLTLE